MNEVTLSKAISMAQAEIPTIPFDKVNPHYKSPFSSLAVIVSTIKPILAKHGLSVSHSISEMVLTTKLIHESGESISCSIPLMLSKQDMQGLGSAITYAKRYGVSAILNLVTDDDDDGNGYIEKQVSNERSNANSPRTLNNPKGQQPAVKSAFSDFKPKPISVKQREPDTSFNFGANTSTETDVP